MNAIHYIVAVTVLGHIAFTGARLNVSLYAIHLGANAATVGLLMAMFAFLPALLSIHTGRMVDKHGVRWPMVIGSGMATLGCLVGASGTALFKGMLALQLTSLLMGTGFMVVGVCVYQVVGDLSTSEDRAAQYSVLAIGFSVGGFLGPMIGGVSIDHLAHQKAFLVLALFSILPAIAMLIRPVGKAAHKTHHDRPDDAAVMDLLRQPQLRRVYINVLIFSVAWDVYNFALPIHGVRIGLSASQIGVVMGTFAAATFVVRLAIPWIARNYKPWTVITAACAVAAIAYIAMPFANTVTALMLLLFTLGLGLGAPQPMVLAILHDAAPPGRSGEAVGVRILLINLCQTVMPLLFGLVGTLGMLPVFWATAAFLTGGGFLAHQSSRRFGSLQSLIAPREPEAKSPPKD